MRWDDGHVFIRFEMNTWACVFRRCLNRGSKKMSTHHPAVSMSCHFSLLPKIRDPEIHKKGQPQKTLPRKTPSHPSPMYNQHHHMPSSGRTPPTVSRSNAVEGREEGFVVREPFEMRARGGVVALLLRDDGSTRNLGMPRTTSFSRSRQAFYAKRSGRLAMDVIFNFTWTSAGGGTFRGLFRALPLGVRGSGLGGIHDGGFK